MKIPEIRFPESSGKWVEKEFNNIFKTISTKQYQIKNSEIYTKGLYPVVDQGKNKIAGYSDNSNKLLKNKGIIIFGDHTTILKYIDFDFIVGADGVKLLKNKYDIHNLKFLYYSLIFNNIKPEGYKRHFSILKQLKLHIPPTLTEQEKIAEFLSAVDEKIEITAKKIEKLKDYKKGLLQKMLNVINGEPEIRFKEFSGKWVEKKLEELNIYISDGNYGELYPTSKEFVTEGIAFIRANNIKNLRIIKEDMRYISKEKHKILTSGHLKTNDILVTTRGEIGEIAYVDGRFENANINAQICLLRADNKTIYNKYLLYQLALNKNQFLKFQTGSALKQLPKKSLKKIKIFLPPTLEEQQKIADFLSSIDEKIELEENRLEKLKVYKKDLLQKMFV
jgi:type I restriction enzyme S subunit